MAAKTREMLEGVLALRMHLAEATASAARIAVHTDKVELKAWMESFITRLDDLIYQATAELGHAGIGPLAPSLPDGHHVGVLAGRVVHVRPDGCGESVMETGCSCSACEAVRAEAGVRS